MFQHQRAPATTEEWVGAYLRAEEADNLRTLARIEVERIKAEGRASRRRGRRR